jgi:hypothetical protein
MPVGGFHWSQLSLTFAAGSDLPEANSDFGLPLELVVPQVVLLVVLEEELSVLEMAQSVMMMKGSLLD